MKRTLSLLLVFSLLAGMLGTAAFAAEELSGSCGENLTWTLSGQELVISGTGDMYDYSPTDLAPWMKLGKIISVVHIQNGVTGIGDYAFTGGTHHPPSDVRVAATVTRIGACAFLCDGIWGGSYAFFGPAPEIAPDAFTDRHTKVFTLQPWSEEAKQNYGGELSWYSLTPELTEKSKLLFAVDEPILTTDLVFQAVSGSYSFPFEPLEVTFDTYDNSTCGQKTVKFRADGFPFSHTYFVTDGQTHLDAIRVVPGEIPVYSANTYKNKLPVTVNAGELLLEENRDYTLVYQNYSGVTAAATVTVKGAGNYAGFEKTITYPILRRHISTAKITVYDVNFGGTPLKAAVSVYEGGTELREGTDYRLLYDSNVNVGTGTVRIMGLGKYYGCTEMEFRITAGPTELTLKGNYLGQYDGELSENIAYSEKIIAPGQLKALSGCSTMHVAGYALYKLEGEDAVLIKEYTSQYGTSSNTAFTYDFSSIYEGIEESSGEIYMLSYSWMDYNGGVYGGAMLLGVPSKVAQATAMTVTEQEADEDYRSAYFALSGTDGALKDVCWSVSDPSVATVENGNVQFRKPGTVTVTAQSGELSASSEITVSQQQLWGAKLYSYSKEEGAKVIYDCRLLEEGIDYTLSVEEQNGQNVVTVTGCGLFAGQLVRSFDRETGEGAEHTHTYTSPCDTLCTGCKENREGGHSFGPDWVKNTTHHWHACTVCGEADGKETHTLSADDSSLCTVCGKLYIPGDVDGSGAVNRDDVIALLLHISMPDMFPISAPGDLDGGGTVDRSDVITLLLHVTMPDAFPLS